MPANTVRVRGTFDDKISPALGKIDNKFKGLTKSKGFQTVATGIGLGAGIGGWNLLQSAIGKATDVVFDSIAAAREEETSIAKLTTALRANVPGWDGQTAAMERVLQTRMKLGFSDDEQRDSLALLVAATHDETQALDEQRTAMDLSRLKGISLAEASAALVKVEGGQFRMLKSLGIELPKNATQTEALAAVQRVAQGQAESYARTNTGKLLVSQVKVGEAMERLGGHIMPMVTDATVAVADVVEGLTTQFENQRGPIYEIAAAFDDMGKQLDFLAGVETEAAANADMLGSKVTPLGQLLHDIFEPGWREADRMSGSFAHAGKVADDLLTPAIRKVGDSAGDTAAEFGDMVDTLKSDINRLINDVYDPIETRDNLMTNRIEADRLRVIIASKKSTDAEVADARRRLRSLESDNADYLVALLESGDITSTEYKRLMTILERKSKTSTGKAKSDVNALITKVKELYRVMVSGPSVKIGLFIRDYGAPNKPGKQHGGPVHAGEAYTVGEAGPETLVMGNQGGTIIPNGQGWGGGITVNFNSTFPPSPSQAQQTANAVIPGLIRELRRQRLVS